MENGFTLTRLSVRHSIRTDTATQGCRDFVRDLVPPPRRSPRCRVHFASCCRVTHPVHTAYIRAAAWRGARPRQQSHLDSRCPAGDIRRARTFVGRPNACGASLAGGHDAANGFSTSVAPARGGGGVCLFITRMRPIRSWRGYVQARGGSLLRPLCSQLL